MGGGVCLSVCLSRAATELGNGKARKPKFGRMEGHNMSNQWTYLEVKRSKVKGQRSRSINAHILMPNIFRTKRPTNFKLGTQTEDEDQHHRQAPWPPMSKVKVARSRDASDMCWPISRGRNVLETPKLVGRLSTSRAIVRTSFKVKDQRSRSPGKLMLRPEVRHIFRTRSPTNFKFGIQTEHEDPHHRQAQWPPRSKVKVARSRDAYVICWPINRGRNVL